MVERHIEKIILAVFLLLLVFVVFRWGVSSPLEMEVVTNSRGSTEVLPPREADGKLLQAAQDISRYVDEQAPTAQEVADYRSQVDRFQHKPFRPAALASLCQAARLLSGFETPQENRPSLKQIEEVMPAPTKPSARVERELPRREGVPLADIVAAHVASTYPWQQLKKKWMEKLPPMMPVDMTVAAVEAEVMERRYDGSWGAPVPVTVARIPLQQASGTAGAIPTVPDYDGTNGEQVRVVIDQLGPLQAEILEPSYWDILWYGREYGSWRTHLPDNPVSDKMPKEGPGTVSVGGGAPAETTGTPPEGPVRPGAPRTPAPAAPRTGLAGMDKMMFMKGGPMGPGPAPTPVAPRPTPAVRPTPAAPAAPKEIELPKVTPVPRLEDQMSQGEVLFWLHVTSLEPAKVYQFRVRLVFVNPLVAATADADKPEDAKPALVRTQFSEWSNPVWVPQETEFFVTGQNASQGYASVTVFARKWGQRVSKRFNVSEGQAIGEPSKVKLMNPEDESQTSSDVDFSTGAAVVRLDFNKTVMEKGNTSRQTVEMFYVDGDGELKSRIEETDKVSERYDWLKEETDRARTAGGR